MEKHQKFLEFNGKSIIFLNVEGEYFIALRPICEALNVDVRRSRELVNNDPILGPEVSKQTLQVSKNGVLQGRSMTCIPEKYIYGFIFSLRSDSKELVEYKRTCYELLYNHFHGTITNRKELLQEKSEIDSRIHSIKQSLKERNNEFKELSELESRKKKISQDLNKSDKELIKEPELFEN